MARNSWLIGAESEDLGTTQARAIVEAIALMSVILGMRTSARRWWYALPKYTPNDL